MENWSTPVAARSLRSSRAPNETVKIPESPAMVTIGRGTGVNVYSFERSPRLGLFRSPWAVKKVNRRTQAPTDHYEERLTDEASVLRRLNHPNIVGFRAFVEADDGQKCLAMEVCETSLGDLIESRCEDELGPFSVEIIMRVGEDVSKALDYLHNECFILHGDLKSFNILIKDDFKTVKLCDFGVCLRLDKNGVACPGQEYVGTECWLAPEAVIYEEGAVTSKVDIFAFGLVLWEMMSLLMPHMETSILSDASFDEDNFCSKIGTRPEVPDDLGAEYNGVVHIFNWSTEADPASRPSAQQLVKHFKASVTK